MFLSWAGAGALHDSQVMILVVLAQENDAGCLVHNARA